MHAYISTALELSRQLIDPRGRCNRQGFLALAITLLVLQALVGIVLVAAGQPVDSTLGLALNAPLFWIGAMATLKRLHDMDRTGWWIPAAFGLWVAGAFAMSLLAGLILGPEAMQAAVKAGSLAFWILFAGITLPAFGALLWLHASNGDPRANRFGDVPGRLGFSPAPNRTTELPEGAVSA
jgi:uncharacterized membrane protein YhaH (DUF805 family)